MIVTSYRQSIGLSTIFKFYLPSNWIDPMRLDDQTLTRDWQQMRSLMAGVGSNRVNWRNCTTGNPSIYVTITTQININLFNRLDSTQWRRLQKIVGTMVVVV